MCLSGFGAAAATLPQRNGAAGRGGRWLSPGAAGLPPAPLLGGLPPAALWVHTARRGNGGAICLRSGLQRSSLKSCRHRDFKLTCMMAAVTLFCDARPERTKVSGPPQSQNGQLHSLQLISGAPGSSGRRLRQITFSVRVLAYKKDSSRRRQRRTSAAKLHQGRNNIRHTNLDASVEMHRQNSSSSNAAPRAARAFKSTGSRPSATTREIQVNHKELLTHTQATRAH